MFEAKLTEGHVLKKIIEAIKDIVNDVNIDVSASGKYSQLFKYLRSGWKGHLRPEHPFGYCLIKFTAKRIN
jgi:hypothetical protein